MSNVGQREHLTQDRVVKQFKISWTTTISYIYRKQFEIFNIHIPPNESEQQAIAQILSDMDAEIEALKQKQAKYKAINQGMIQELLTGKTRLV